ncbi:hypothetical protein PO909_015834 [Leuciscus waleckii]
MVCPAVLLHCFIWISLMATGVQDDVTHIIGSMCVVQQSTVLIPCKYIHPQHEQLSSVEWLHEKSPEEEVRVSQDPAFEGRVEFVQSDARNCSLILRDVRKSDAGIFRLVHNTASGQIRMNAQGIRLDVTDAEVEVQTESDNVTEGDWILFICGSCIPSMTATYIWRKDGRLHSRHHGENLLYLESVGLEDRGRYLCTISGHEGLNSTSVDITVRPVYPPKNVSVSVSPSGVIVEGDSVTLNCISDSNPPAEISWIKGGMILQSGDTYSITNIKSEASGNYYCSARNKHRSLNSSAVTVNVMYPPKSVSVSVSPSGVIVEGDSVTLNCISDSNPPALNFSWFKENETSAVGSGQSFSISSFNSSFSGRFYCEAQNKYGSRRSVSLFVSATVAGGQNTGVYAAAGIGAALIGICIIAVVITILRKRVTPSEERNHRGSRHHKTVESPEDAYMTLDPKSRCSEYDTLDNMKRSCDTDNPEDQDTTYYNMDK